MNNPITEYFEKINSGEITACEKVKTVYRRLSEDIQTDSDYFYDEKRANYAVDFIEKFCKHSKGEWANKPVILELWQKALICATFGVINKKTNRRRFKEVLFIVGKKNGKSLLASAISLYMMIADGEGGAECYSVATKREQARIIWQEAERMVKKSPALRKRVKCLTSKLVFDKTNSFFKTLSSDSNTEDGLNIFCGTLDEIHAWKGVELYNIVANGVSARREPLIFITSTAGFERESIFDLKYDEASRVLNGYFDKNGYKDDAMLPVIYELDNRSEWSDPACWIKANPNLGVSKSYDYLIRETNRAKEDSINLKNVLTKEFNIRETSTEVWLNFEDIDNQEKFDITELKPDYAFGGTDLSSTTDLTSACLLFKLPNSNKFYLKSMYWLPSELLEKRANDDKVPYDIWYRQGWLRISNGNKVDYDDVVDWYVEMQNDYGVYLYKHGYDSWSSTAFIKKMNDSFGEISEPVIQGKKTLSEPMKMLGADLKSKLINYDNNPITKWCFTNVRADVDKNDNIQPAKTSNERRRIDGFASCLNAYVQYTRDKDDYLNLIEK